MTICNFDSRRSYVIPGDFETTLRYAVDDWISLASDCITQQGYFAVALSGGTTPQAIYQRIKETKKNSLDWKKVLIFFSDERAVSKYHPDSNYKMGMDAGFKDLGIPIEQIFPMEGEGDLEANAKAYETLILTKIPSKKFDLIMLGVGEDGHTASLFPKTHGLHTKGRLAIANFIPEKSVWRLTLTFECIEQANRVIVYAFGASKNGILKKVFTSAYQPDLLPIQRVGSEKSPALFVLDDKAAGTIFNRNSHHARTRD